MESRVVSHKPRVFLATPFSAERAGGEDPERFARVQASIEAAAESAGVELDHPKGVQEAGRIPDQIFERLTEADAVLGVLTGDNPNVLFEIGFAARRAPILIIDDPEKLPFDLRIYRAIGYGGAGELDTLTERIAEAIRQTLAAVEDRMDPPIEDYLSAVERHARTIPYLLPEALSDYSLGDLLQLFVPVRLQVLSHPVNGTTDHMLDLKGLLKQIENDHDTAHCLITGGAGCGKTTHLHVLAAHAWGSPEKIGLVESHLPLLVSLRSLARASGVSVAARLRDALDEDRRLTLSMSPPEEFISDWARRTRRPWLFLLDGLDEVPGKDFTDLLNWLAEFLDYSLKNGYRVILTSRPLEDTPLSLRERLAVFRLEPLDNEQLETLSRKFLGESTGQFLNEVENSRLRIRLRDPLLVTLAAARFGRTGEMPTRRVALLEYITNTVIDHAREHRLRDRLGERIAAGARSLLEQLAVSSSDKYGLVTEEFLVKKLDFPEVEAGGRAAFLLDELARSSGILVRADGQITFSHLAFLEYFAAANFKTEFTSFIEQSALVEKWWDSEFREITLNFLGLIEDQREVSRLLKKIYPTSWFRRAFARNHEKRFRASRFVVDCILDGCSVEPALQRILERDLRRMVTDTRLGPVASELLGKLGDPTALLRLAKSSVFEPLAVSYALAALFRLGEDKQLSYLVRDESVPLQTRLGSLILMAKKLGPGLPVEVLEGSEFAPELRACAVAILVNSGASKELLHLLREGRIAGDTLDNLAVACANKGELDVLFEASFDEHIDDTIRSGVREKAITAVVVMLKRLAAKAKVDRTVRAGATWLVGGTETPADLGPILTSPDLSEGSKFGVALVALERDPKGLTSICEQSDLPMNIRAFVVEVLAGSNSIPELEGIVVSETVASEIRTLALTKLYTLSPDRAFTQAALTPPQSPIRESAMQILEHGTRQLQTLARDEALDDEARIAALSRLAEAERFAAYRDLIKNPGPDSRISQVALAFAAGQGYWPLIVDIIRDEEIQEKMRAVGLHLLQENHRTRELRQLSEAEELPRVLRIMAAQLLQNGSDQK